MDSSPVRFLTKRAIGSSIPTTPLAPVVLSRAFGATATPTSALVPWNSCGAYIWSRPSASARHYFPYVIFNFASPLLLIVLAILGFRRIRDDNGLPNETAGVARL